MAYEPEDLCQLVQQALIEVAGSNAGETRRHQTGFFDAVRSEMNVAASPEAVIMDSQDGKGPKLAQLEFWQRSTPNETYTDPESVCEDGEEVTRLYTTRAITKYVRSKTLKFTKSEMRKLCEAPPEVRARVIRLQTDAMMVRINRIGIAQYLAGRGGFYNGVSGPKNITVLDESGAIRQSDPNGQIELEQDFANMGYDAMPLLVGAGNWDVYARLAEIGCCNAYGQDIGETADYTYYRDTDVDRVAASDNNLIAFYPGAVQFVSWLENKGDFAMRHAHFDESTVVLPGEDLEVDFEMNYDRCDKVYTLNMGIHFDFFLWPANMYKADDDNFGVNGAVLYKALSSADESA